MVRPLLGNKRVKEFPQLRRAWWFHCFHKNRRRVFVKVSFLFFRLSLILSSRIPMSSAAHTTSASSAKLMMLVPAGRSMRRKSSYMTFQISGPTRDP